jgi:hypothetical protein
MTIEQATLLATEIHEQKQNILPQLQHFPDGTTYLLCAYTYKQAGQAYPTYQLFPVFSEADWEKWEEEITDIETSELFMQILKQHAVLKRCANMEVAVYLPASMEQVTNVNDSPYGLDTNEPTYPHTNPPRHSDR